MSGQAVVDIWDKQWSVNVATTPAELSQGLSGIPSMLPWTGMLFDLGSEQAVTVNAYEMLFPLGVVFIDGNLKVTEVVPLLEVGGVVTSSIPCRYFLEVNVGEVGDTKPGDTVTITGYTPTAETPIIELMVIMMIVVMMMKMMMTEALRPAKPKMLYEGPLPAEYVSVGHSIHGPERETLVDQYGTWAVGRAESVCPEDDVECVRREAARLLYAYGRGK